MQWHSAAACKQLCYAAGWSAQELVNANGPLFFLRQSLPSLRTLSCPIYEATRRGLGAALLR